MKLRKLLVISVSLLIALIWLAVMGAIVVAGYLVATVNHQPYIGIGYVAGSIIGQIILVNLPPIKRYIRRQTTKYETWLAD